MLILQLQLIALITIVISTKSLPSYHNKIILIRHGEKPTKNKESNKLSKKGIKRAQCFRSLFGPSSDHNIGLIIAQDFDKPSSAKHPGGKSRPYYTVAPLAKDLGLKINHDCDREDAKCVKKLVEKFAKHSNKDILICWKHSLLGLITTSLTSTPHKPVKEYPDDRYDIMWFMRHEKLVKKESEMCSGLDVRRIPDPDLDLNLTLDDESDWEEDENLLEGENWNEMEMVEAEDEPVREQESWNAGGNRFQQVVLGSIGLELD